MNISADRRQELVKIGKHEAAHYVAAKKLGFETGDLSLELTHMHEGHNGGSEIILSKDLKDIDDVVRYLRDRIVILYSGVLGESLNNGKVDNEYACEELNKGATNDDTKCRELLQILNNICFSSSTYEEAQNNLQAINDELWNIAADIVQDENDIIEGLGRRIGSEIKSINKKFTLTNEEIESLPAISEWLKK